MIIDDEHHNIDILNRTLKRDYNIKSFFSAENALIYLKNKTKPSLIISDQRMPGLTGIEFLKQASKIVPECSRIIVSGYTDQKELLNAINMGCVDQYITKPWKLVILKSIIEKELIAYDKRIKEVRKDNIAIISISCLLIISLGFLFSMIFKTKEPSKSLNIISLENNTNKEQKKSNWFSNLPKSVLEQKTISFEYTKESIKKGEALYIKSCLACHGDTAKGDGIVSELLNLTSKPLHKSGNLSISPPLMLWAITHGIKGTSMKSFSEILTKDEISHIINYIIYLSQSEK